MILEDNYARCIALYVLSQGRPIRIPETSKTSGKCTVEGLLSCCHDATPRYADCPLSPLIPFRINYDYVAQAAAA